MGEDAYERVADLLDREVFEARVRAKVEEWVGLLSHEAAVLLVLDELGRNPVRFSTVAQMVDGVPVRLKVRVDLVGPLREYRAKGGKQGRVVDLAVSDASGSCTLVLWDEDVGALLAEGDPTGVTLRLLECTPRQGLIGMEVVRGRWGVVVPER